MKALKTLILLLIAGFAGAQIVYPPTGNVNGVNRYKGVLIVDSGIVIPMRDTLGFFGNKPTVTVRPQDSTLYYFNGNHYQKIETDLTKFVKYSDSEIVFVTPTQLRDSIVANSIDTTSLSNRIDARQKYSDTTSFDATRHWVSTRGYLTAEIDGSITNELQTLSRSGNIISLSNGGGGFHDSFARYTPVSPLALGGTYPNYSILWNGTTDNVSEGATNQYFTNTRARNAISASGDLSYNSSTGVMSYTLPMATPFDLGGVKVSTSGPLFINGSGALSLDGSLIKTVTRTFSGVTFSNGYGAIFTIDTVRVDNVQAGMMTQADKIKLYSSGTGSVTSVGLTGSGAISFSGSPITTSGTITTSWTGTTSQYIRGDGSLATFPTIPTVNNGTLTLSTSGIATGSGSFTANQSGNSTFTVNVPPTNIGGSLSGTTLNLSSSTGSGTSISLASLVPPTPTLQDVTTAGNTSSNSIVLSGGFALGTPALDIYTTAAVSLPINVVRTANDLNPLQRWSRGSGGSLEVKSVSSGSFAPSLAAYNPDAGSNFTLQSYGKNDIGAGAAINLRAGNSTNSGVITGGTVFRVSNWTTQLLNIDHNGATTLSNLAGSGSRIVTADASGNLSATIAAPLSGTYSVAVTAIPANSQVTLGTATVTGASVGDVVEVTQPANALFYKARVTASNTVTIYAINPTTSSISTTAETINIRIIK